jgi:hypothetical protein
VRVVVPTSASLSVKLYYRPPLGVFHGTGASAYPHHPTFFVLKILRGAPGLRATVTHYWWASCSDQRGRLRWGYRATGYQDAALIGNAIGFTNPGLLITLTAPLLLDPAWSPGPLPLSPAPRIPRCGTA